MTQYTPPGYHAQSPAPAAPISGPPGYPPAPQGYPPAPQGYPPAPQGYPPAPQRYVQNLADVNPDAGMNLIPQEPQPGQPPIQRVMAVTSFVFNGQPPASKKGPRKPRYEIALTVLQSSLPSEQGQKYTKILRAAQLPSDMQDYGIAADSRLLKQIVAAVHRVDVYDARLNWLDLQNKVETRNFEREPCVIAMTAQ